MKVIKLKGYYPATLTLPGKITEVTISDDGAIIDADIEYYESPYGNLSDISFCNPVEFPHNKITHSKWIKLMKKIEEQYQS